MRRLTKEESDKLQRLLKRGMSLIGAELAVIEDQRELSKRFSRKAKYEELSIKVGNLRKKLKLYERAEAELETIRLMKPYDLD